nr:hypothetical protein [Saccharopolyspora terrae]
MFTHRVCGDGVGQQLVLAVLPGTAASAAVVSRAWRSRMDI